MAYDRGDLVRCEARMTDPLDFDEPVDPGAVTFTLRTPSGAISVRTYAAGEIVRRSSGVFTVDVNASESGLWRYRFEATGTYQGAVAGAFSVKSSF